MQCLEETRKKRETREGIKLLNQEIIGTCNRKESYEYLDILEADIIKQKEMTKKLSKEYLRKKQENIGNQTLQQKLN